MVDPADVAADGVSIPIADDHAMVRSGLAQPFGHPAIPGVGARDGGGDAHDAGRAGVRTGGATAGASGYIIKSAPEGELLQAVRAVAAGGTYLTPGLGAGLARMTQRTRVGAGGRDSELERGSILAGHRIDGVAGRGEMGVVYCATDLLLDRRVALKLIAPAVTQDPVFRERFERECCSMRSPALSRSSAAMTSGGCGRMSTKHPPVPSAIEPDAPAALDDVLARALAKGPDDRQQSAGELARQALAAVGR